MMLFAADDPVTPGDDTTCVCDYACTCVCHPWNNAVFKAGWVSAGGSGIDAACTSAGIKPAD